MSKHLFKSALSGRSVTVDIGWDAPLQHYYMTITADSLKPTDRPTIIYSSLGDVAIDGGASDPVYYWAKLEELHIVCAYRTIIDEQIRRDAADPIVNRIVWHGEVNHTK